MKFTKPAISHRKQVEILQQRGMSFNDEEQAASYLKFIGYYRLSAYWYNQRVSPQENDFKKGTTFEEVARLYEFDRSLRVLLLKAVEQIEVAIRATYAFRLSQTYDAHAHLNAKLYNDQRSSKQPEQAWSYGLELGKLKDEIARSKEKFIKHFENKYDEETPPIWAVVEVMSLGKLSKWFANLKKKQDRNSIAREFGFHETVLVSFLHHLTTVRNACAHHSRVWNRKWVVSFKLPTKYEDYFNKNETQKIYNTLVVVCLLLNKIDPKNSYSKSVLEAINKYSIDVSQLGFPNNYSKLDLWKN